MRKSISLIVLISITLFAGITAFAKGSPTNNGKALTQYVFVMVDDLGATLRGDADMTRILKSYGFSVSPVKVTRNKDYFTASRNGTSIRVENMEGDRTCIITFKTQAEVNTFEESLINSHWIKKGSQYEHPNNNYVGDCTTIFARIQGKTVILRAPF